MTTPEVKLKQSIAGQGRTHTCSDETRAKLSEIARNRPAETRAKIAAANRGRVTSAETKAKLSAALKGKPFTQEHRCKIVAALKVDTVTGRFVSKRKINGLE